MKRLALLIGLLCVPLSAVAETPRYVLSSCMVNGCSGNVVSAGPKYACILTASHCFRGRIGGTCKVKFIDGSTSEATLLAIDRVHDLARLGVPTKDVLGSTPIAIGCPDRARFDVVGWPGRDGDQQPIAYESRAPHYFLLRPAQQPVVLLAGEQFVPHFYSEGPSYAKSYDKSATLDPNPPRWAFDADDGGITPGTSGSPVFANGQMVGVLSNNNGHSVATSLYCATPGQLIQFMRETDEPVKKWNMGEWSEPVKNFSDAGPKPKYASNRPIKTERTAPAELLASVAADNAEPVPMLVPTPRPDAKTAPQLPPPPPPDAGHDDEPSPVKARAQHGKPGSYDGKGRPPEGYRHPRERSKHIIEDEAHDADQDAELAELKQQNAELMARLEAQENKPEPQPIEKPQPKQAVVKKKGHPLLALMLSVGIVGVGLVVDAGLRRRAAAKQ